MAFLARHGALDRDYIAAHTSGFEEALAAASASDLACVARQTGLRPGPTLRRFFALFSDTQRTVTVYSQGVNQSSSGTDKVNAIINCHLATGRIGKPGMGPFSVTGQPNAMGGREVGGLANMLAAHMDIDDAVASRPGRAASGTRRPSPTRPGLKAVDMFQAVADGRIKALWIMATNPVDSMPDADAVRGGDQGLPLRRRLRRHDRDRHDRATPM